MADAQASGACGSNIVWVQVPSPALTGKSVNGFLFYFVQIIFKAYWLLMVCNRCLHTEGYSSHRNLIIMEMGLQREEIESILY